MCKPCNREYQRGHYLRNRDDYLVKAGAWLAIRREENVTRILDYFAEHRCVDCGEGDPAVLHFDHRGDKLIEVSNLIYRGVSWERIEAEIEKCDVRCAVCHFKRHAVEGNWLKLTLSAGPPDARVRLPEAEQPGLPFGEPRHSPTQLKWCGSCGWDLPITEFSIKTGSLRSSQCKTCKRAYSRDHYRLNRASYLARIRVRHQVFLAQNMALLVEYLRSHPCVDCSASNPVVLQFDHVRGVKSRNIAQMIRDGVSWRRVEEEIAKCDVRCVNCHFRRHARDRNTRKHRKLSAPLSEN